jgi:hypothetical protein
MPHITPMFHATGVLLYLAVIEVVGCYALVAGLLYRRRRWFAASIFLLLTIAFAVIYRFSLPIPIANVFMAPIAVTAFMRLRRLQWPPAKTKDYQTEAMRPLL